MHTGCMADPQPNRRGAVIVMQTETGWIVDEGVGPDPIGPFKSQEEAIWAVRASLVGSHRVDVFGLRGEHIETIELPEFPAV